jgi:uncharacterized protein YggE
MQEEIKTTLSKLIEPKYILVALGILAITSVAIVSILRERLVSDSQNQVSITGQGKISYQPDIANVTLGVQVDRSPTADAALKQLNEKISNAMTSLEGLGIKKENIKTEAYTLTPQYDYKDNISTVGGYSANQKLIIKVVDIVNNAELVNQVVSVAGNAAANQVLGIEFTVSNMNDLKQQARVLAIQDAKSKSSELAKAAGIKLGKVENWYENTVQSPESPMANVDFARSEMLTSKISPQVPAGLQEIIMEVNLNYEVK